MSSTLFAYLRTRKGLALSSIVGIASVASATVLWPRPARLIAPMGFTDTIVVNSTFPTRLGVSVVDQYGRRFASDTAVRFRLVSGSIDLSPTGATTCSQRDDAVVQATFTGLVSNFAVHCRPVVSLEAASWMWFVVGDSARHLSFAARGPSGELVTELRGSVTIDDGSVAEIIGTRIRPKKPGRTLATVAIGDRRALVAVLVHRLVASFGDILPNEDLLAVRVRLARGDTIEMPVPNAAFWVKYYSMDRGTHPPTIELRGDGSCTTGDGINAKRVEEDEYAKYCNARSGTTIVIGHGQTGADTVAGTIALELNWR